MDASGNESAVALPILATACVGSRTGLYTFSAYSPCMRWPGNCHCHGAEPYSAGTFMDASVVIATANRSGALRETLASLARIRQPGTVELIVVDNRSTDDTRQVVEEVAASYPF